MIKKASSIYGMGDALNQRAFLVTYCNQKNIPTSRIAIYTERYWWMFEGLGFTRGKFIEEFRNLVPYNNFGLYDMPKRFRVQELDKCIALNADIDFSFETIVPLPNFKPPEIELPEKFITFNTGFGDFSGKPGQKDIICLKSWPKEHWEEFVKKVGVHCVQIGGGPSCEIINGTELNLVDKLTIQESAEVMRKAMFHVDMEGGLPILNQHLGKKSVVLFGPTAIENQGRSFNLNIRNSLCPPCYEWGNQRMGYLYAKKDTLSCKAKCMREITPDLVIREIKKARWI